MKSQDDKETGLAQAESELSPQELENRRWERKLAELAKQGREARRMLVEEEASIRDFRALTEFYGEGSPEEYPAVLDEVTEAYLSGKFFLRELSLFYEIAPRLSLTVFQLRQEWIRQYDLRTVPEFMLLDLTMLAYFNAIRVNKEIGNMLSLTQRQLYGFDCPMDKFHARHKGKWVVTLASEQTVARLQEVLMPLVERFNQMFLRNLKAMRELKASPININIGQADQVNVAQQQVNVKDRSGER